MNFINLSIKNAHSDALFQIHSSIIVILNIPTNKIFPTQINLLNC